MKKEKDEIGDASSNASSDLWRPIPLTPLFSVHHVHVM